MEKDYGKKIMGRCVKIWKIKYEKGVWKRDHGKIWGNMKREKELWRMVMENDYGKGKPMKKYDAARREQRGEVFYG